MTDGEQTKINNEPVDLKKASTALQAKGVDVFTLAIGLDPDIFQLVDIVSKPEFFYRAQTFDALESLVETLTAGQCIGTKVFLFTLSPCLLVSFPSFSLLFLLLCGFKFH